IPPDITGQIDQPVQVEIVRGDGKKSADLNKVFIAAKDPEIEVPANFIALVQCGNPGYFGNPGCGNRQALHTSDLVDNDFPPRLAGTDTWKVQLPKGWQLTTLSTYNEWGGQTESGFEVGPPESATFQFNWQSDGVNIQTNNIFWYTEKYYQLAKYSIMI